MSLIRLKQRRFPLISSPVIRAVTQMKNEKEVRDLAGSAPLHSSLAACHYLFNRPYFPDRRLLPSPLLRPGALAGDVITSIQR